MKIWGLRISRWIFALFYLFAGVMRLIHSGTAAPFANPEAEALNSALRDAQFVDPLLAVSLILGSILMLFHRTAPLGIVILAPLILVFSLFHATLNGTAWFGALTLAYFLLLAWAYRSAFVTLWSYGLPPNNSFKPTPLRGAA
ncbi:MAG: hypothetical protein NVV60_11820 [Luteimonas sp.]|nr:hypothetical protein [Luteimonas sp.]MCR6663798.1 hypothetical protein [Luteimonas sp.]